jgi:hypothetical protein
MHYCIHAYSNLISTSVQFGFGNINSIHLFSGDHILYHIQDTKLYILMPFSLLYSWKVNLSLIHMNKSQKCSLFPLPV